MGVSSMIPFITTYWPHGLALVAGFIIFRFMTTVYFEKRSSNGSLVRRDIDDVYEPMTEHEMNDTFGCDDFREKEGTMHFETTRYDEKDMIIRSKGFYLDVGRRRTVREFSDKPVPIEVIENIIKAAGTSPSGAHLQPWMFVVIQDKDIKSLIRQIVEDEEHLNYQKRMGVQWVNDLKQLKTSWQKPYIETAPYLILVFEQVYGTRTDGSKQNHYYSRISTSIACGILLTALQNVGLCTVTSTPLNAGPAIRKLVERPSNEKLLLLLPIGYPADNAMVPVLQRKPLNDIMIVI